MKLAILSDTMSPTPTPGGHGLGRAVYQLAENLLLLGHDVTLYALEGSTFNGELITVPADKVKPNDRAKLEPDLARLAYSNRARHDVYIDGSHKKILSGLFTDIPVINWYHDKWQPYRRNAVLCSEGQRHLMTEGKDGDPRFSAAKVVHNQLEAKHFIPSYRADDPPFLLFLGFVYKWKNPILAIESASRARMRLFIGGQFQDNAEGLFHEGENAILLGALPPALRNEYLRGALVYLQLGHSEAFGLTTIEAGLSGTATVAWPSGGNLDTVSNGVNGVFVDPRNPDKVEAVCLAIEQARRLDRRKVRQYTEDCFGNPLVQAQQFEELAENALGGRGW